MLEKALTISEKVVAASEKKGMESIELFIAYNSSIEVILNGTSIGTQRAKEETGVGVRVVHNGAEGFSYSNIITLEALTKAADEAFSVAKLSPSIEGLSLPVNKPVTMIEGTFNEELASLGTEQILQDASDFITGFTSVDARINTVLSGLSTNVSHLAILNSNAINLERKNTNYQAGLILVASDSKKAGSFVFDVCFTRKHDVNFLKRGEKLAHKALDGLRQEPLQAAFDGSVILHPYAISELVAIVTSLAVSGDWRQRGTSFWKDKLADKVADNHFHFIDKPHDLQGGGGVKAFDDEGVPTHELEIIKDGVLQTFLHNTKTANKENLESTGNATRSFGSRLNFTQKPTNILPNSPWILAGDMTEEEMIADTKKGLYITNYTGTIRYQNGIFSGVAKGAYLIENGELVKPVTGISLSGNIFDLLNNISGIGKDYYHLEWLTTPIMRFEGIKISTK